jgi:membrane protease YdiL (CAAX protease family)
MIGRHFYDPGVTRPDDAGRSLKIYQALNIRDITGEPADNVNMCAGIDHRIRRLGRRDRLLLLLTGCWAILAIPGNYFRVHGLMDGARQFRTLQAFQILWMLLLAAIAGVIAYSVIRHQRRPADYGFSFRRGGVASLALLAAVHLYLLIGGKFVLSATGSFFPLIVWGALMEELVFRAIAIDQLIQLMDGIRGKAFWAILASSTLFTVLHIASKTPAELLGIFSGSLVSGYIYYKSRSILLPAWIHGVANAGYLGGIWIAGLCCLISFADWAIWPWNKQTPPVAGASRNIDAIHSDASSTL